MRVGIGIYDQKHIIPRPAITNDSWGVCATENVTERMMAQLGFRWTTFAPISVAGLLEYGQEVATESAKGDKAKAAFGLGYFGAKEDFIKKFDAIYIFEPQSVAYEGEPYGITWNNEKRGYNLDFEVGTELSGELIKSLQMGVVYEILTRKGFDGEGAGATETSYTLKVALGFLEKKLFANACYGENLVKFSAINLKTTTVSLGASYVF